MPGLYATLIQFFRGEETDDVALAGLDDIHRQMVIEWADAEGMTYRAAREHLHL